MNGRGILGFKVGARLKKSAWGRVRPTTFPPDDRSRTDDGLVCQIEELLHFRDSGYLSGWAFHPEHHLCDLAYQLPGEGPTVIANWRLPTPELIHAYGPQAAQCGFTVRIDVTDPARLRDVSLNFSSTSGGYFVVRDLPVNALARDPYHRLQAEYFQSLRELQHPRVLEIGSRNRTGQVRRDLIGPRTSYVGLDVVDGENVDVVGDAHNLSRLFEPRGFDSVFSVSTFEHLAMPWKAAIEANRVMKVGATLMVATHQTWPLHEQPWDFWRFSDSAWSALFNRFTGFEVVHTAMGEPASVVSHVLHSPTLYLPDRPARLASAVVCRKTGEPRVDWEVPLPEILDTRYKDD
jgi:Methyltransferase domain